MSSTTVTYGLSSAGFFTKTQSQITAEIIAKLRSTFGNGVNLQPESLIGQITYIFAEREADVWQLAEAIYLSQFPNGAEGVALDNILSLNNLTRLTATPSVTNPSPVQQTNGLTLYGLILFGTAGTVVPAGSTVQTQGSPSLVFAIDNSVTIQAAVNAQQTLIFSNPPTEGSYALQLSDINGNYITSPDISFAALPAQTQFFNIPLTSYQVMVDGTLTPAIAGGDAGALAAALNNAGANITATNVISAGLSVAFTHAPGYIPAIDPNPTIVAFSSTSATGTYALNINGTTTTLLSPGSTPAQVQAAIVAAGFPTAKVAQYTQTAYAVSFGNLSVPASTIAIAADTTPPGTITPPTPPAATASTYVIPSVQSSINTLVNTLLPAGAQQPYTDVGVSLQGSSFLVSFGANAVKPSQPSSGGKVQPVIIVPRNSMKSNTVHTNLTVNITSPGAPAQAIATATCSTTGPTQALAGQLSVIGSPVSGWSGVTNPLDTIPGTDDETDTQAVARRLTRLSNNAIGPLEGIKDRIAALPGVTSVEPFENTSQASLQNITFSAPPASGTFQLILGGTSTTVPISCVPTTDSTSGAVTYHPTADEVQTAINGLQNYGNARVAGSVAFGFSIDFSNSLGAQSQPQIAIANNSTGVVITTTFGRTPNSFEMVVTGGDNASIARAIYAAKPAGIASYATPAATTPGSVTVNSAQLTVTTPAGIVTGLAIFGTGVPNGTTVASINGNVVTMSNTAMTTKAGDTYTFSNAVQVADVDGNPTLIGFSRPVPVLFYVNVQLTTDQYRSPGVIASGHNVNSQFQPGSVQALQSAIVDAGNAVPVGGLVIGAGTGGLIGSFNNIPGVVGYTLGFDTVPNPIKNTNIQLLPIQQALFEVGNVSVSYL